MILGILRTTNDLGLSKGLSIEETNSQEIFTKNLLGSKLATSHFETLAI